MPIQFNPCNPCCSSKQQPCPCIPCKTLKLKYSLTIPLLVNDNRMTGCCCACITGTWILELDGSQGGNVTPSPDGTDCTWHLSAVDCNGGSILDCDNVVYEGTTSANQSGFLITLECFAPSIFLVIELKDCHTNAGPLISVYSILTSLWDCNGPNTLTRRTSDDALPGTPQYPFRGLCSPLGVSSWPDTLTITPI